MSINVNRQILDFNKCISKRPKLFSSSRSVDSITNPYQFTKLFQLYQMSLQPLKENEPKPTKTRTKQTSMTNNRLKMTDNFHLFPIELPLIYGKHAFVLPLSLHGHTYCTDTHTEKHTHV